MIDFKTILEKAESYRVEMSAFLRDMIRLPSESCNEKEVVLRIKEEMEKVGFDKIEIDPMGNILGYIGRGKHLLHTQLTSSSFTLHTVICDAPSCIERHPEADRLTADQQGFESHL